jgi:hypothetical protein
MTRRYLDKLLSISSPALGPSISFSTKTGMIGQWLELMTARNGFYAFESALLVRPAIDRDGPVTDVKSWNSPECWLDAYTFSLPKMRFFAEDIFGEQFAIKDDSIVRFDPETGDVSAIAPSFEEWAERICTDYSHMTGHSLAHSWQSENGALAPGERLLPRTPFVLGGDYSIDNLQNWNDRKGMRARGFLAAQLRNLPDGSQVSFVLEE